MTNAVGPCSIMCYTCFGYTEGGIRKHAAALHELYKGWYEGHVNIYSQDLTKERVEKLHRIIIFNEMLQDLFAHPGCTGCQTNNGEHGGCIKGYGIPKCSKERGVRFCADCEEFPCQRDCVPERIKQTWLDGNTYIKEHGLEQYFEKNKGVAHYIDQYNAAPKNIAACCEEIRGTAKKNKA